MREAIYESGKGGTGYSPIPTESNQSGSDSDAAEGFSLPLFMVERRVQKYVRVRSAYMRIPVVMCQSTFCFATVFYLIFSLQILMTKPIQGKTSLALIGPQSNWITCHEANIDCTDTDKEFSRARDKNTCNADELANARKGLAHYYMDNHPNGTRAAAILESSLECKLFDANAVGQIYAQDEMMIATTIQEIEQEKCPEGSSLCIWDNKQIKTYYVSNVGDFLIKVRHTYVDVWGETGNNAESQGFLEMVDGTIALVACQQGKEEKCPYTTQYWKDTYQQCYYPWSGYGGNGCFSTGFADFFTVELLMKLGGIDLNAPYNDDMSIRYAGVSVALAIRYTDVKPIEFWNFRANEFWRWTSFGLRPRLRHTYTYSIKQLNKWEEKVDVQPISSSRRKLIIYRGIKVTANEHGEVSKFDFVNAIMECTTCFVLFGIVEAATERVLLYLYKKWNWLQLKHIVALHHVTTEEQTPNDHEIRDVHDAQTLHRKLENSAHEHVVEVMSKHVRMPGHPEPLTHHASHDVAHAAAAYNSMH